MREKWDNLLNGLEYKVKCSPLVEEDVTLFEKSNEITLPEDYRYFLLNVGNGIIIKNGLHDLCLGEINVNQINKRLKEKFPFNEKYKLSINYPDYYFNGKNYNNQECSVAIKELKYDSEDAKIICKNCKYLNECIDASWNIFLGDEFDGQIKEEGCIPYYNGSLTILDMGFEDQYRLVTSGMHKGEVWLNNWETEFIPVTKSFYEFLLAYKNKDNILKEKQSGSIWNFEE